jgi:hypothetical protein
MAETAGMSYRPITDTWILARPKLREGKKYYGAYLGGFPERARALLGVTINDPILHVCGGMARYYPYAGGFGPGDKTLDLDPATEPDYLQDAREPFPLRLVEVPGAEGFELPKPWPAILVDPPYSEADATHYVPGEANYPSPNLLLKHALAAVRTGGRVGIIHYLVPQPPREFECKFIACIGVFAGFNNRMRAYSVFEKLGAKG